MSSSAEQLKSQIRRNNRQTRQQLSATAQYNAARLMTRRILAHPMFRKAKRIALYAANDGEISTSILMQRALDLGKQCYLPRIVGQHMYFHRYKVGDQLKRNTFGISEPLRSRTSISAYELDLVCLPLVAFDKQGRRLGMGGGFYDRCFAKRQKIFRKQPMLLGCAHACQEVTTLPYEAWDIPLDYIVTDKATLVPSD